MFAIACVTVWTLTRGSPAEGQWSLSAIALTTALIWTLPLITGNCYSKSSPLKVVANSLLTAFTALGLKLYGPVSGNWSVSHRLRVDVILT